ncbi:MAG: urease accessory protein UreD [Roseobacter sp.]
MLINTAGGITGGDQFDIRGEAGAGASLTLTTQAAERVYKAQTGQTGWVKTHLTARPDSQLFWLPQETILYDKAALQRSLRVDLAPSAQFLMCEAVIFGRHAMGETVSDLHFHDRVDIRRDGKLIYRDGVRLTGDAAAALRNPAVGAGARAMASVVWVAPHAQGQLDMVRKHFGKTGGASMLDTDVMVMRLLAEDGFLLRRALVPVLDLLTRNSLPQCWRL